MNNFIKKFRFIFIFISVFWHKHKRMVIVSFIAGAISFSLLPELYRLIIRNQSTKIGLIGKYTTDELPLEVLELVSDGLTKVKKDGRWEPALAESWEVKNDGKEYIFKLRNDIYWQDGKPVLAKDIDYNFSDVAYKVISDKEISFILKDPFSPFPAIVSRPIFKNNLVGTGKYKVTKVKKNGQIVGSIALRPAKGSKSPNLIFRFYPTEEAGRIAFKLGEIRSLRGLNDVGDLKNQGSTVRIDTEVKENRFAAVFFNTQNPKLADKSLRQALAYAIEKKWNSRAINPINPNSWAYNPETKTYDYDLARAKELFDIIHKENPEVAEIELSTTHPLLATADAIKLDWDKLGVNTKIKLITSLDDKFEALLIAEEIPADPDQYVLWHSTQKSNISLYKSPKIDKLLEDGRRILDEEERLTIYQDFQRFLVEDTPVIFLFHPTVYTVNRI